MTAATEPGQRPIRVGNCSGFYGDRASAMADMARAGGIDVLTGDYLAEVTMLILGKARAKDSTKGYATTFLQHLDAALDDLVANRIRLVVNAGGLNPGGLAAATRELIARHGHDLRVSHIEGDDVSGRLDALQQAGHSLRHLTSGEPLSSWPHQPLTANAYLGGFGIARALEQGADIVSVASAAEALQELSADSGRFNLLVSDIGMPESTGYDLIEIVRKRLKVDARHLPAVALTAFARREDSEQALDKGFQKHLAKPVQVGRLIGAIRQLTGRQQARATRARH